MQIMLTVLLILTSILYIPLNRRKSKYYWASKHNEKIPLLPFFVVPYLFFFIYVIYALYYFWDSPIYLKITTCLIIMNLINAAFWTIFPNGIKRPKIPKDDLFSRTLKFIYQKDNDTNGFPSGHVSQTLLISYFLIPFLNDFLIYLICTLILFSVLFTKQHIIKDIIGGTFSFVITLIIFNEIVFIFA